MHDYQTPDRGWCGDPTRGAAMGRGGDLSHDSAGPLTIRRVPLDDGGYDPGGTYWGSGRDVPALFCVSDAEGAVSYVRARDFDAAKIQFPNATWEPSTFGEGDLADMVNGYIAAALWSTNDESDESGGEPLDANYDESDLAAETRANMTLDCVRFVEHNALMFAALALKGSIDWSCVGHDFWLTRNGHGCGFWDGGYPKPEGDALTESCKRAPFGEVWLYVGDDGQIHSS